MMGKGEQSRVIISRQDFLKVVILAGSSLGAAGLIKLLDSKSLDAALATAGTGPYYYGSDTSWDVGYTGPNASNFPQNFYIGRTGAGLFGIDDAGFYVVAAQKAGVNYTHTYWELKGPLSSQRGARTCHQFGLDQGTKAGDRWFESLNHQYINGKTIFADIEEGTAGDYDGWASGPYEYNVTDNRLVLKGFLDGIANYAGNGVSPGFFNPGIYTRPNLWEHWFGGDNYEFPRPVVVWLTGYNTCAISCSPCGTCTSAKDEADDQFNTVKEISLSRYKTVIWQFYIKGPHPSCQDPSCTDYDIARQNGYLRFEPVTYIFLPFMKGTGPYESSQDSSNVYPSPQLEMNTSSQNVQNAYPPPSEPHP